MQWGGLPRDIGYIKEKGEIGEMGQIREIEHHPPAHLPDFPHFPFSTPPC